MDESRIVEIQTNLGNVLEMIAEHSKLCNVKIPRLIAVSKTMPISDIKISYDAGQKDFGENYVVELAQKIEESTKFDINGDIRWHYIGALQSNKLKLLASLDRLYSVHTLDTIEHATILNKHLSHRLRVMIQLNISKEERKHGIDSNNVESLIYHVIHSCPMLDLYGLMTIGAIHEPGKNVPEFKMMMELKEKFDQDFGLDLELCMGMSADYKAAIEMKSTMLRIGTGIFGKRNY